MPTGYTADIEKGISFKEYAMGCARAFGALIEMREKPHDAKIPELSKPHISYYEKEMKSAIERLAFINSISITDAKKEAEKECLEKQESDNRYYEEKIALKKKYEDMLKQVRAWTPPNSDFDDYKSFMESQILGSIEVDCGHLERTHYSPISGKAWIEKEKSSAIRKMEYNINEIKEEIARTNGRNKWLRELRESFE